MKQIVFAILNRGKGNTAGAQEVMIISDNTKESEGGVTEQQLAEALLDYVEKDGTKVLSDVNFTTDDATKLNGIHLFTPITENQVGIHPAFNNVHTLHLFLLNHLTGDGTYPPDVSPPDPPQNIIISNITANGYTAEADTSTDN